MRCPKCGYISFDRLEKCLNCNKDIEAVSSSLAGSIYKVQAPSFLNLNRVKKEESSDHLDLSDEESFSDEDEFLDDDLEILVGEDEAETEEEITLAEDEQVSLEPAADGEETEDEEIEFDFSQFEDEDEQDEAEEEAEPAQEVQETLAMEIPDELSDMSDLAPPAAAKEEDEEPMAKPAGVEQSDADLDELQFDLGLDDLNEEAATKNKPGVPEEVILALDEIDFSETLTEGGSSTSKESDEMDMDEDLNFDLDLGGLSIHDDR